MKKPPSKPTVIIDSREQQPLFEENPEGDGDIGAFVRKKLDAGDYSIEEFPDLVIIERKKSGMEMYSNFILNKDRWLRQVDRMRKFRHRYILIEQSYDDFLDAKNWAPIKPLPKRFSMMAIVESWLIAMSQNENIHFIFAGPRHIKRIAKRILMKSYEYEKKAIKREEKRQKEQEQNNDDQ